MESEHLAIDGSVVSVRSEANLRAGPVTTAGWAIPPSLTRAHPFTAYPAGHSRVMEEVVRREFPQVEVSSEEELSLKDGTLRVGEVTMPGREDGYRVTVGAWEGRHSCMTTSVPEGRKQELVEMFDSLEFRDDDRGLVIDSPIVTRLRAPELIHEVQGLGVVTVRPAIATEMERIPRSAGRRTRHGEVFRVRAESRALLFLGRRAVVRIQPTSDVDDDDVAEAVDGLDVEWLPRPTRRLTR